MGVGIMGHVFRSPQNGWFRGKTNNSMGPVVITPFYTHPEMSNRLVPLVSACHRGCSSEGELWTNVEYKSDWNRISARMTMRGFEHSAKQCS